VQEADNTVFSWEKSTFAPGTKIQVFFLQHLLGTPSEPLMFILWTIPVSKRNRFPGVVLHRTTE
jgi:hypothetical protein